MINEPTLEWVHPEFLYLLFALPVLFITFWFFRAMSRRAFAKLAEEPTRELLLRGYRKRLPAWRHLLWLLAIAAAIVALARPRWGYELIEVNKRGLDILMVVDTSTSMLAEDLRPNRLDKAKFALLDFSKILKGDRIGLVAFSGSSFLQCPLTSDYPAFRMTLNDLYPGIIGKQGTDIGGAIDTAIEKFDADVEGENNVKVIILITDGEDHENKMAEVAAKLVENNITLFAVGAATEEGAFIPIRGKGNKTELLKSEGQVIKSVLNEGPLIELATITQGFYIRASSVDFGLETILTQGISKLGKNEGKATTIPFYQERYGWFLALGLLILAVESLLGHHQRT